MTESIKSQLDPNNQIHLSKSKTAAHLTNFP